MSRLHDVAVSGRERGEEEGAAEKAAANRRMTSPSSPLQFKAAAEGTDKVACVSSDWFLPPPALPSLIPSLLRVRRRERERESSKSDQDQPPTFVTRPKRRRFRFRIRRGYHPPSLAGGRQLASNELALSSPILLWNQITPTPLNDNLVTVVVALERQKCVAAAEAMTINRERLRLRRPH